MQKKTQYFLRNLFAYSLISLFVYLFIPPQLTVAEGEFQADYDVGYSVSPNGTTIVTQNVTLTNKLTNWYPKQYSILIDTDKIKNIIASDQIGVITPNISQKDGKTEILLSFNQQVVGLGNALDFILRFENEDIARKNGSIWEVNVPGIVDDADLGAYTVTLQVPPSFGPAAYLTPPPADGFRWTKEQMTSGGISAAYGEKQFFHLTLSYYLQNSKVTQEVQDIALPPDTAFQQSRIVSLDPKPVTVIRDPDGNWLARYILKPNQTLDIEAQIRVMIRMKPRESFIPETITVEDYLKPTPYWDTKDPTIVSLAQELSSPRDIYNYVVGTLSYDYNRVNQNPVRKGAVSALLDPKNSLCMEFTDLFVAIARARGIPAREAVGYAYTTNAKLRPLSLVSDVLHAWPEYYDSEQGIWIGIDPTWANTTGGVNYFDKLDFNHIVFAIHGATSDYPYPAGFYRKTGKSTKDVNVRFAQESEYEASSLDKPFDVTIDFPKIVTSGLKADGTVVIQNTSSDGVAYAAIAIRTMPNYFSLTRQERNVPPFGTITIPIDFQTSSFLLMGKGVMTVDVNGQVTRHAFEIQPMYWIILPIAVGISITALLIWFLFTRVKPWRILKKP